MPIVPELLDWMASNPEAAGGLATALVGGAGSIRSARKGYLKNVREGIRDLPEIHDKVREIPEMKDTVDRVERDQEEIKNGLIALADAHDSENVDVDPETFRRSFSDNHSSDYTAENDD